MQFTQSEIAFSPDFYSISILRIIRSRLCVS